MGSVPVNDENLGVHRGGKRTSSSDDIFAIEQPTGRQSILRQTENLPNKTVPKGGKVSLEEVKKHNCCYSDLPNGIIQALTLCNCNYVKNMHIL
jgi:hypothetical protein